MLYAKIYIDIKSKPGYKIETVNFYKNGKIIRTEKREKKLDIK